MQALKIQDLAKRELSDRSGRVLGASYMMCGCLVCYPDVHAAVAFMMVSVGHDSIPGYSISNEAG
jgi:hypothetical protein